MRRIAAFGLVGLLASAVHFLLAAALLRAGLAGLFGANLAGFALAFAVSYAGHYRFSFAASAPHRRAAPRFLATALAGLALNNATLALLVLATGSQSIWLIAAAITVAALGVYLLGRFWAFA